MGALLFVVLSVAATAEAAAVFSLNFDPRPPFFSISQQIRSVAAVGGNIATASPISDLNPIFVACGAVLTVASAASGTREIPMTEFFLAYRKTALKPDEVRCSAVLLLSWF